jgi:hypothetical protein
MNFHKGTTRQIPNSISFASTGVTKQETFITFLLKLAQSSDFLQYVAFATKYLKIYNIGLFTIQDLIWCLLYELMAIETVAIEASCVDGFGPKGMTNIIFTQH